MNISSLQVFNDGNYVYLKTATDVVVLEPHDAFELGKGLIKLAYEKGVVIDGTTSQ